MIRVGQAGMGALALPGLLQAQKATGGNGTGGKAKSVILIYLWGGPPQMDMWDPNPEATSGIRSLFKPIRTKVPGIHVSEAMPLFAKWTHKTAIIRSLTHDSNEHGNSVYYTLTGHKDKTKTFGRNKRSRKDWPSMGSVLAGLHPLEGMPATVTIPRPVGHDGVTYSGTHAGFMGPRHDPFEIGRVAEEKGTDELYPLSLPKEVSKARLLARNGLTQSLENLDRRLQSNPSTADFSDYREQALGMLLTSKVKDAIDLKKETTKTRERYGRNEWGEAILTARRLVESGVNMVQVNLGNFGSWDLHGNNFPLLKDFLFPIQEFLVEILLHHRIHERFALRRLVVFWNFYGFLARHGIPLVPIQGVLTGAEYRNPRATPQAAVVDSKNLPRRDFLLF